MAILGGFAAGMDTTNKGFEQLFKRIAGYQNPVRPTTLQAEDYALSENLTGGLKVGHDIAFGTGQAMDSTLAAIATGGIGAIPAVSASLIGTGVSVASTIGNDYTEARIQGYSDKEAVAYSVTNAAVNASIDYVLGGVSKVIGKSGFAKKLSEKLLKKPEFVKKIASLTKTMGESAAQEYLVSVIDPIVRNATYNENNVIDPFSQEKLYEALLGAAAGVKDEFTKEKE